MQNAIFFRINKKNVRIDFSLVRYIVASKNYIQIVTKGKTFMALMSLRQMEELLPPNKFCRIHRSYIISLEHITAFDNVAAYIGEQMIPIGEHYRSVLPSKVTVIVSDVRHMHPPGPMESFAIMETPN